MMNVNAAPKQFASPDNFEIVDTEMTTIAERGARLWLTGLPLLCGSLAGRAVSSQESAGWQRVPKSFDTRKIGPDRCTNCGRVFCSPKTTNQFSARARRQHVDFRRVLCGGAGLRDVFLFGLERSGLHHRRNQAAGKKCAALTARRHMRCDPHLRVA